MKISAAIMNIEVYKDEPGSFSVKILGSIMIGTRTDFWDCFNEIEVGGK